ncbi:SEC13 [Symbiodinium pilosum]|uniref:SEC13 protein n=1 Tax=Symbiodinium pilosum TaxID=2952 RepID=A0A812P722_SYMPI|nr:SEC13 [Symbiodinium pilosum]
MTCVVTEFDCGHAGAILDTQLDDLCLRLATASSDGLVKLWNVENAEDPSLICDLAAHAGAVNQVSWAPVGTGAGALLVSAGADGRVFLWGPCQDLQRWQVVHEEDLSRHGEVTAVSWAPLGMGAAYACALSDGNISVTIHQGTVRSGETDVSHRWQSETFAVHKGKVNAVSWSTAVDPHKKGSLAGACLATAGEDGLRVWHIQEVHGRVREEELEHSELKEPVRDVAWKPWDGCGDVLAFAKGKQVGFLRHESDSSGWTLEQPVKLDEEVWKLEWQPMGSQLVATCGEKEYRSLLLKQQLCGKWDVIDVSGATA